MSKRLHFSWHGIVMTALFIAGGITCLVFAESEMAMLLIGAAIGQHFPEPVRPLSRVSDSEADR